LAMPAVRHPLWDQGKDNNKKCCLSQFH
jgi:hypothetical protein